MSRISSTKATFFYKRIFPFLWFGVLLLIIAFGVLSTSRGSQASNIPFLIVPVLMGVVGYRFMQKMVFCLADEVLDAGDALVVRNGGQEERISLSDIKNVNYSPYMSPPQVTLSLRRHTVELSPKVGDGGNRKGGISWGCLTPPLLHRRSDMPCLKITSSS